MASSSFVDMDDNIITELLPNQLEKLRKESQTYNIFIIKFGAEWCGPCNKIKETCENYFYTINKHHKNIICIDIDVDETIELFTFLKTKKMVKGLPTILAYYGGNTEHWFIPNDSVSGADIQKIDDFFERCIRYSNENYELLNAVNNISL